MKKPYTVNLWGSHPDEDNDDCWTGDDFATLEEAENVFSAWEKHFHPSNVLCTSHLEITGPSLRRVVKVQDVPPEDDSDWKREIAMEAGMLHGVQAYNETMGWD